MRRFRLVVSLVLMVQLAVLSATAARILRPPSSRDAASAVSRQTIAPSHAAQSLPTPRTRIVVTGNSIARSASYVPVNATWSYRLLRSLDPDSEIQVSRVRLSAEARPGFRLRSEHFDLVNVGVDMERTGATAQRVRRDVLRYRPDVVLVVTGTNDIAHDTGEGPLRNALERLTDAAARDGARIFVATVPAYEWRDDSRESATRRHNAWVRRAYREECVDLAVALAPAMRVDRGHFGVEGNRRIAKSFLASLVPEGARAMESNEGLLRVRRGVEARRPR